MSHPILVTGAAGGRQGSTGRVITSLLLEQGIPVRALVHKLDSRSDALRRQGAEVVEGDLLDPASVQAVMRRAARFAQLHRAQVQAGGVSPDGHQERPTSDLP